MSNSKVYSQGAAIAEFFNQTYATPASCDCKALDLVGGEEVVPVEVQGVFSYTVYAGPQLEYVVQFRLRSLKLDTKTAALAAEVYGSLAPTVKLYGELGLEGAGDGDEVEAGRDNEKEPLLVYVMDRIRGLTHLNFILKDMYPQNSKANFAARKNLMTDIARYVQYMYRTRYFLKSQTLENHLLIIFHPNTASWPSPGTPRSKSRPHTGPRCSKHTPPTYASCSPRYQPASTPSSNLPSIT
jgi:hypothetical protein